MKPVEQPDQQNQPSLLSRLLNRLPDGMRRRVKEAILSMGLILSVPPDPEEAAKSETLDAHLCGISGPRKDILITFNDGRRVTAEDCYRHGADKTVTMRDVASIAITESSSLHIMSERQPGSPKIGVPPVRTLQEQEIGEECTIIITKEIDRVRSSVYPKNPVRNLHPGDKITFMGGNNFEYYLLINGEGVAMRLKEIENLRVVLEESN